MKHRYFKEEKHLSERERAFILQMAEHGDATKAVHAIYAHLSDQAARVVANGLMKRRDINEHIDFLKKRYEEIERYVDKIWPFQSRGACREYRQEARKTIH